MIFMSKQIQIYEIFLEVSICDLLYRLLFAIICLGWQLLYIFHDDVTYILQGKIPTKVKFV
jgi:hypothetical protein